jgi:hypothetical protein
MLRSICLAAALSLLTTSHAGAVSVFFSDFDGTLAPEINPGSATLTGVQGYAGLGASGNQFGGSFLRTIPANTITLTLSNLPQHDSLSLASCSRRSTRSTARERSHPATSSS